MTLAALRDDLAADMTAAGLTTYPHGTQAASAPVGLVEAGDPYLEQGQTFNSLVVRFSLYVLVEDSPRADKELDEFVQLAVATLEDYDIERIELFPATNTNNDQAVKAAKIILTTEVARTEVIN